MGAPSRRVVSRYFWNCCVMTMGTDFYRATNSATGSQGRLWLAEDPRLLLFEFSVGQDTLLAQFSELLQAVQA